MGRKQSNSSEDVWTRSMDLAAQAMANAEEFRRDGDFADEWVMQENARYHVDRAEAARNVESSKGGKRRR